MYILSKDGLWLLAYQTSGHKEIIGDGSLVDVPTCLWGGNGRDAMTFESLYLAEHIAKIVGAQIFKIEKRS